MGAFAYILTAVLLVIGIALTYLGEYSRRHALCPVEPALPVWMVTAGSSLLVMTLLTLVLLVWKRRLMDRHTVLSVGWAFCCALLLLVGYMIWFGLWIAGSYFTFVAIQKMRITHSVHVEEPECNVAAVSVAGVSIVVIWTTFIGMCVFAVISVYRASKNRHQQNKKCQHCQDEQGNIYDAVAN